LRPNWELYHYRDKDKREIDLLVKTPELVIGLEIKSSATIRPEDGKHLLWFGENIVPRKNFLALLLYTGDQTLAISPRFYAIPMAALWQ
jgi:predicted AAA+ superfamily ATPase